MENELVFVDREKLYATGKRIFSAIGLDSKVADISTLLLLETDIRGVFTHGTVRIPVYAKRIQKGLVSKGAEIETISRSGGISVLDAHNCMGQYVGTRAMENAIESAKDNGIGAIAVRNSNHLGEMALYSLMAAKENMIGFCTTNAAAFMAPTGGAERMLGNNPFSFAVPAGKYEPVVLDMSCSRVAGGKVMLHSKQHEPVPEGWILDNKGQKTTDSNALFGKGGSLIPLGAHKGYGLSLIMEILTVALSQGLFSHKIQTLYDLSNTKTYQASHFFVAMDVSQFQPIELFTTMVDELLCKLKSSRKAEGVEEIYYPGEIEHKCKKENIQNGFKIKKMIIDEIIAYAGEIGVENEL